MIDAIVLRQKVESALSGLIGTYIFSNGGVVQAVRVEDGAVLYPESPVVDGLEVVIVISPEISIKPMMGGYQETYSCLICLKQWDIRETTLEAMERLLIYLPNIGSIRRLMRDPHLDNIEETRISLSETFLSRYSR